jgi:hypothetical protein
VSGLIFEGKSSASGPYLMGERRGWGVEVPGGITVDVDVLVTAGGRVAVCVGETVCEVLHAVKRKNRTNMISGFI